MILSTGPLLEHLLQSRRHALPVRLVRTALCAAACLAPAVAGCGHRDALAPAPAGQRAPDVLSVPFDLRNVQQEVVVTLALGVDPIALALDHSATLVVSVEGRYAAMAPLAGNTTDSLLASLATDTRVVTVETNDYVTPAEDRQRSAAFDDGNGSPQTYATQSSVDAADLKGAQQVSSGRGVVIAVLDTGAELTHPAFTGRIASGWDLIDGDNDPSDTGDGLDNDGDGRIDEARGHGTHVAGIAALAAPGAQLSIVRVLDADGRGDVVSVAGGILWASTHGARVINLSLGMLHSSAAIENALEQADAAGVVCVAAAGNEGSDTPSEYPGTSEHVIAVAAVDDADLAASFTSYGSQVDLSAPGVSIRSSFVDGTWALWSGTSMAAPFVSGTAALLASLHPGWTRTETATRLMESARSLDRRNPAFAAGLGAGALDAGAALAPDAPPYRAGGPLPTVP